MKITSQKKLLVLKKIAFESGSPNSHNLERDICHWQSMFHETPLNSNLFTYCFLSLREIFFIPWSPTVMKKHDESALMHILQEFETLEHVDC